MYAQQGRPDLAFPIWRNLMAESTADAPWLDPIRLQIEEVAALAGERVTLADLPQPAAPAAPGPTPEQIEAAAEMAPEDRSAMIEGMVAGLADRLATEGGPPEDWARLITAFGVLGRDRTGARRLRRGADRLRRQSRSAQRRSKPPARRCEAASE
jgi:cytochrome c-type biogenesis protein CcmH